MLSNKKKRLIIEDKLKNDSELKLYGCDVGTAVKFEDGEKPLILDVGCGMSYATGRRINGKDTDFRYIDPLANYYNGILGKKHLSFPKIDFGMIEYLSSFVGKNSASLIIINNELDHSFDPVKGMFESLKALKIGGVLYLLHRKNEAEHENYRGFHQFNIDCKDGQLVIWNKESNTNISEIISEYVSINVKEYNNLVMAVITKKCDLDIEKFYKTEEDQNRLCTQIMYLISKLLTARVTVSFGLKFFFLKIFHWIASKFSSDFKEKVKKMLHC